MNPSKLILPVSLLTAAAAESEHCTAKPKKDARPNVIVILADDLGFSDIGCYGGEIHTPNLDRLAANGLRFNNFYNTSRSCPTRASLLTGLYQHQAGIGRMTFDDHLPGYRGTLSKNAVTIAEALRGSGYHTGNGTSPKRPCAPTSANGWPTMSTTRSSPTRSTTPPTAASRISTARSTAW